MGPPRSCQPAMLTTVRSSALPNPRTMVRCKVRCVRARIARWVDHFPARVPAHPASARVPAHPAFARVSARRSARTSGPRQAERAGGREPVPPARRCLARPRPFRRGRLGRGRSCAAESHLSHLIPPNPASNLSSAGGVSRNRTATLARDSCWPGIRNGGSACGRLTGSHRASPRVPGPAARPRCPFRTAVRRTGRRDRAGHTAAASGLDRRTVRGRSVHDDRLCDLLVAAAGASAGLGHEQRGGRLALGCVFRRLRPRGPFPHRNDRSGRRPPRLHSGRGALRRGPGWHVLPGDGILVRLAVARDRRRRSRRMLHAGPQGAHRPPARGTAGARGGLLHGLLSA